MKNNLFSIQILSLLIIFLSLFACLNETIGNEITNDESKLLSRVHEYYNYEKESKWGKTYYFRTPLYQKSISYKYYKTKMNKDNTGFKLLSIEIVKYAIKGKYAVFSIEFIEKVPDGYFLKSAEDKIKILRMSTWEKINNIWYCRDASSRLHLDLNSDMVMESDQRPINEFFDENLRSKLKG